MRKGNTESKTKRNIDSVILLIDYSKFCLFYNVKVFEKNVFLEFYGFFGFWIFWFFGIFWDFLGFFRKNPRVYEDFFELTTPRSCLNGGSCHEHPTGNGTSCICPSNLSGSLCKNAVDSMARCVDPSPCLNGGTCHQSNGEILCLCPAGFSGPRWADNVSR